MGAKGSAEAAAKMNAENWGHIEVRTIFVNLSVNFLQTAY